MKTKKESAFCIECGKGQITGYKQSKLCNRCYGRNWAREDYRKNPKKRLEKIKARYREKNRCPIINNLWSFKYDECIKCKKTEHKHSNNGLCSSCFDKQRYPKKHKKYLKKLYSDEKFHQREKEKFKRFNKKRWKEKKEEVVACNKKSYLKNRDKRIKEMNKRYAQKRKELLKKMEKSICLECGKKFKGFIISRNQKFCSYKCSQKNYKKNNKLSMKKQLKIYGILNQEKISNQNKRYRKKNYQRKRQTDINWYINNYDRVRFISRINQILKGKFPNNNKNQIEILEMDISFLKKRIKELEIELNKPSLILNTIK